MRLKHNPWVSLLAMLTLAAIVLLTICSGRDTTAEAEEPCPITSEHTEAVDSDTKPNTITGTDPRAKYGCGNPDCKYGCGLKRMEE